MKAKQRLRFSVRAPILMMEVTIPLMAVRIHGIRVLGNFELGEFLGVL